MSLPKNKKNKGFTLIELLMVIALSSVILFGVFQGYTVVKRMITHYFHMVRLQNNIKQVAHEFYSISDNLGQFGCVNTAHPFYLHVSKNSFPLLSPLLSLSKPKLKNFVFYQKTDPALHGILPKAIIQQLKPNSDIVQALEIQPEIKGQGKHRAFRVYADCQEVFIVSPTEEVTELFANKPFKQVGDLQINYYYVAKNKRKNNQGQSIYSLYKYNANRGVQEVLEGVDQLCQQADSLKKLNILTTSVEGAPPLRQWISITF